MLEMALQISRKRPIIPHLLLGELVIYTKKGKIYPYLTPFKQFNSPRIKDLNMKGQILKLLEENIRLYLYNLRERKSSLRHKIYRS